MPKVWRFASHDEVRVRELSGQLRVPALMAQVLITRGCTTAEQATAFLNPRLADLHDPNLLPGVPEAADRVVAALKANRRITIYGDYDVDGVTSTCLLWHCLKLAGGTVDYYIPHRLEEGYGLNCDSIRQLHTEDGERLVISVDCGVASLKEAELAKQLGLELIVTDHHRMAESLPVAACVVHPRLPGSQYPFGDLCGAGVAFKLAWAICQRLGDGKKASPRMREFLVEAVSLAAIGTIADVVPLLDENRILVRHGLSILPERASCGLKAIFETAEISGRKSIEADDIGFAVAPRLNAAGRLGQARLAVELLTTENPERAAALSEYLNGLNRERQTVERRIFKQAKELVANNPEWSEHPAFVLAHRDWHAGVIGIVASRVAEHYERPTILVSLGREDGVGQGSGRSFAGFDLHAGLAACSDQLLTFGGHSAAAGLKIHRDRIDDFRDCFRQFVVENHDVTDRDLEQKIDAEIRLADLTHQTVKQIDRLGPFGQGNRRPVFSTSKVELVEPPKKMGQGERHLSLRVRHYGHVMRAIAFGKADWADEMVKVDGPISICFSPKINRFRGYESVELELIDWNSWNSPSETPSVQNIPTTIKEN